MFPPCRSHRRYHRRTHSKVRSCINLRFAADHEDDPGIRFSSTRRFFVPSRRLLHRALHARSSKREQRETRRVSLYLFFPPLLTISKSSGRVLVFNPGLQRKMSEYHLNEPSIDFPASVKAEVEGSRLPPRPLRPRRIRIVNENANREK